MQLVSQQYICFARNDLCDGMLINEEERRLSLVVHGKVCIVVSLLARLKE